MKRKFNRADNQVHRAVALAKLDSILVDAKLHLYTRDQGDACSDLMEGISVPLSVIGLAYDRKYGPDAPDLRVLRGGLSACRSLAATDYYDKLQTTAIDHAIEAAKRLNNKLDAVSIEWAMLQLYK